MVVPSLGVSDLRNLPHPIWSCLLPMVLQPSFCTKIGECTLCSTCGLIQELLMNSGPGILHYSTMTSQMTAHSFKYSELLPKCGCPPISWLGKPIMHACTLPQEVRKCIKVEILPDIVATFGKKRKHTGVFFKYFQNPQINRKVAH